MIRAGWRARVRSSFPLLLLLLLCPHLGPGLAVQIAAACEFLELKNVVHRSLAAEFVVVSEDGKTVKLSNVGEVRRLHPPAFLAYLSAIPPPAAAPCDMLYVAPLLLGC